MVMVTERRAARAVHVGRWHGKEKDIARVPRVHRGQACATKHLLHAAPGDARASAVGMRCDHGPRGQRGNGP